MRLSLLFGVLAATALVFYSAVRSLSTEANPAAVTGVAAELESQAALMDASRAEFDEQAGVLNATIDDLNAEIADQAAVLEATASERGDLRLELDSAVERLTSLEAERTTLAAENSELSNQVEALTAAMESRDWALEDDPDGLRSQLDAALQRLGTVEAENITLGDEKAELTQRVETLTADIERFDAEGGSEPSELQAQLDEATQLLSAMEAEKTTLSESNSDLTQQVATLRTTIETQETALREAQDTARTSDEAVAEGAQRLDMLLATVSDLEQERDGLTERLAESEASLALLQQAAETESSAEQIEPDAELMGEIERLEAELATRTAEATGLTDEIGQRDAVILGLLARAEAPAPSALASCQDRSDAILSTLAIGFEPGTATIAAASVPQLQELATLASDCIEQDLSLEIEGHTGSGGGIASNLLLSDGRAKAIRDFLIENGVSGSGIRAVGFGGSDPVTAGDSTAGELQNERIVFDWEQN